LFHTGVADLALADVLSIIIFEAIPANGDQVDVVAAVVHLLMVLLLVMSMW